MLRHIPANVGKVEKRMVTGLKVASVFLAQRRTGIVLTIEAMRLQRSIVAQTMPFLASRTQARVDDSFRRQLASLKDKPLLRRREL